MFEKIYNKTKNKTRDFRNKILMIKPKYLQIANILTIKYIILY